MKTRTFLFGGFLLLMFTAAAGAHGFNGFYSVKNGKVNVEVYFSRGGRPHGAKIRVFDKDNNLLLEDTVSDDGTYSFVPPVKTDLVIRVDAGEGHFWTDTVPADMLGETVSDGQAGDDSSARPQKPPETVTISRKKLLEMQSEIRFRDILGGIGYIVGATGVAMYFLSKRQKKEERAGGTG
ncbi:MAG: hypothetical protein ABIH04_00540 [Planctomycetota bacterium]